MAAATPALESPRAPPAPLVWACAAFGGGVLLHVDRMPLWAAAAALALIAWRLVTARARGWYPGTTTRALLALGLVALVFSRFHTLNGLAAGTTLLVLMAALKLLETRQPRDEFVMVCAGLFLLLAACLDRQQLSRAPLYALQAWVCCAALATIATPSCRSTQALRLGGRALLLAVPLALALFVFFPRLGGAFWAIPRSDVALTGLSDAMTPGGITQLVASYEPAFRVTFLGAAPPPPERYWRGPVLHEFDGSTWRRSYAELRERQPLEYLGTPYHYRLTLQPNRRRWWLALDTPAQSPDAHVLLNYDNQLLATDPVNEPISFTALSYTRWRATQPLAPSARREDTALPPTGNPRTRELAQELHARAGSDAAFLHAVLEYLRTGGFVYSLDPQPLGSDAIDDFLFNTRAGFCGHYASSLVVLMRAAGVPARVVTGYLGGEWNPIGGYFVVRQSDAHAWTEVWLPERGWTRVDPTAVVAPERLQRGIGDLLPGALSGPERLLRGSRWLNQLLQRWDAANTWWADHVVRFDYAAQLRLLARMGVHAPGTRHLGWAFMAALCIWLALVAWHVGRSGRPPRPDALARAYGRLCRKLARIAPARAPHQGPLSLAAAVLSRRPELRATVQPLLERYAQLRYGPAAGSASEVEEFRRAVARLSLPRTAAR